MKTFQNNVPLAKKKMLSINTDHLALNYFSQDLYATQI